MLFVIIIFLILIINNIYCFETNLFLKTCTPKEDSTYIYEYHYIASVNNKYKKDIIYKKINPCEKYFNCCTQDYIFCWNTIFNDDGGLLNCTLKYAERDIDCLEDFINISSSGICYILNETYTF